MRYFHLSTNKKMNISNFIQHKICQIIKIFKFLYFQRTLVGQVSELFTDP